MNKYYIYIAGLETPITLWADFLKIEDNIYKFTKIDQLRDKEITVGMFPVDKTFITLYQED